MLFTPNYAVSYKGKFYQDGKPFNIAEADAVEMSKHGVVQPPQEPPAEEDLPPQEPPKRAGRTRKGAEQ